MLDRFKASCILLLVAFSATSQQVQIESGFIEDSLSIGESVNYWLSVKYRPELDVLLPDTNYSFSPFEFVDKQYFESIQVDELIKDSAVYQLQSFEITEVQYLSLPVLIFEKSDSTTSVSPLDSIYFRELAAAVSDTTALKSNLDYQKVVRQFNYPLWGILLGSFSFVLGLLLLIFWKKIIKYFKLKRMQRDFVKFSESYSEIIDRLKSNQETEVMENALSIWKKYAESLEKEPFRKLTTTEILSYSFTSELKEALKSIDRSIYGGYSNEEIVKDFQVIEDYTNHRYSIKKTEVQNER